MMRGSSSLNNWTHLPPNVDWDSVKPVTLPPGRERLAAKPLPIGSDTSANTIGIVLVWLANAPVTGVLAARIASGRRSISSFANVRILFHIAGGPAKIDLEIASFHPSQLSKRSSECGDQRAAKGIALRIRHQHADAASSAGRLCVCGEWASSYCADNSLNEIASSHLPTLDPQ